MVFVTLNKSDKEYSPSTLYEDYAISQEQFHWQSMNKVRRDSKEGRLYFSKKALAKAEISSFRSRCQTRRIWHHKCILLFRFYELPQQSRRMSYERGVEYAE